MRMGWPAPLRQFGSRCFLYRLWRKRSPASAFDVDAREEKQSGDEVGADREDGEAVVAAERPRHCTVSERAENRGCFHREAPQAEKFGEALGRREVADDGAAR